MFRLGLQGAVAIDAWDPMGDRMTGLDFPVSFTSTTGVSPLEPSVKKAQCLKFHVKWDNDNHRG